MNYFWSADHHFEHKNIIKYADRPFSSTEEMAEVFIEKWNNKVNKNDIVYYVGDFAFKNSFKYVERLKGQIVLIAGNHDKDFLSDKRLANRVAKNNLFSTTINNQYIVMCHYAMRTWDRVHYGAWSVFGHSHGRKLPFGKSYDVGVDNNNYEPISFDELKVIMDGLPLERDLQDERNTISMLDESLYRVRSSLRGHKIIFIDGKWLYADTLEDIPANGGEIRPCAKCGKTFSLDKDEDKCLGLLPGVTNACCGHGDRNNSYIAFENGVVIRGFYVANDAKENK